MRPQTRVQMIAGLVMLLLLAASAALSIQITQSAGRNRLVQDEKVESSDSRQMALGIAMGAFRGLFVNYLWIRANQLKEDGKYYEAVDLAKTITRLQPRFPKVWQFHAWNLSYNISVATQTPQERWNWVQAGIRLLRDQGIPANPQDIGIHKELAWIHLHKVQGFMDDAHRYYKKWFALEWSGVLGKPPQLKLEELGTGSLKKAYAERWLGPIVDAPDELEELYVKAPGSQAMVEQIRKRTGLELDRRFLERFEVIDALMAANEATGVFPPMLRDDPLAQLIADPSMDPKIGKQVIAFARRRVLVREYHMEPERMLRYTLKYGPLDWRHPAAHALYWSARGSEEALLRVNERNKGDFDLLNTDRLSIQAIQELFRTGSITFDVLNPEFYLTLPNTEYIDVYRQVLRDLVERSRFDSDPNRPYKFYWAGYENFMRDAIRYLYRRGDKDTARRYQKLLYEDPNLNQNNPYLYVELAKPLDDFVLNEIVKDDRQTSPTVALQEVAGSLQDAYLGGLLIGDGERFNNAFNYARLFHEQFQQTQSFKTWVAGQNGRMGFPPFDQFAAQLLAGLIENAGLPAGPIMYRRAPADLQGRTYVYLERTQMRQGLDAAAKSKAGSPDFETWFAKPQNVEAYRLQIFNDATDPMLQGRTEVK